jgi:hypothetical protein
MVSMSTHAVDPYVQALEARRLDLNLSRTEFAERLGVSLSFWSYASVGKRGIGLKLVNGGLAAFPDIPYPYAHDVTTGKSYNCSEDTQKRVPA